MTEITYRDWHPVGRAGITVEELDQVRRELREYPRYLRRQWAKLADEDLLRRAQATQLLTDRSAEAYDGARALRDELRRRGKVFAPMRDSIRIPRCEICRHGSERVFQATQETHDIEFDGAPRAVFLCVSCWSETRKDDD